jgi:hypothetical protein
MHRLLYCPLCRKLISKAQCQKLRHDKNGNLYKVKTYRYDNLSKILRVERREEIEGKRLQELQNIELSKIVNRTFKNRLKSIKFYVNLHYSADLKK